MHGTGSQWVINAVGTLPKLQYLCVLVLGVLKSERFPQLNIRFMVVNLSGCTYKRQGLNQMIQNQLLVHDNKRHTWLPIPTPASHSSL